jgi:hypothetical protein
MIDSYMNENNQQMWPAWANSYVSVFDLSRLSDIIRAYYVQVELYLKQMHDFIFGQRPSVQPYGQSTGICMYP